MIGAGSSAAASFSAGRTSGLDASALAAAWAAARSSPTSWLLATVDHGAKAVRLSAQGEGGYAALQPHLAAADGSAALFGVLPYASSGAQQQQHRHAFFCYLPPALAGMARGRVSLQRAAVYAACEGVVGDLTLEEDLAPAAVQALLARIPGAQGAALQ
jgi:hypothetical protein